MFKMLKKSHPPMFLPPTISPHRTPVSLEAPKRGSSGCWESRVLPHGMCELWDTKPEPFVPRTAGWVCPQSCVWTQGRPWGSGIRWRSRRCAGGTGRAVRPLAAAVLGSG